MSVAALLILITSSSYAVSQWYAWTLRDKPYVYGVSFMPSYAQSLGLNPRDVLDAYINDLGVRHLRYASFWNESEPVQGKYDFTTLDWEFNKAEEAGATVTLAVGLRQPRWPECHTPDWVEKLPDGKWQAHLMSYIQAVVERYRESPALVSYQLENEALLKTFGECKDYDRNRMQAELDLIKKLDPVHPVIMSRSDNLTTLPIGKPRPDIFGFSVYRRVFDSTITHNYFSYPFPAWYYGALAGWQKALLGRDSMIHELQMEPWPPSGHSITDTTIDEQNKSFNEKRFRDYISFARKIGMREIDLWGGEYWYYRKVVLHDDSVWNTAKEVFKPHQ